MDLQGILKLVWNPTTVSGTDTPTATSLRMEIDFDAENNPTYTGGNQGAFNNMLTSTNNLRIVEVGDMFI